MHKVKWMKDTRATHYDQGNYHIDKHMKIVNKHMHEKRESTISSQKASTNQEWDNKVLKLQLRKTKETKIT